MNQIYLIILILISVALIALPFVYTSIKTERRLKKTELAHHVRMIRNSCDRVTAESHYNAVVFILDHHFIWKLTLDDVGYKQDTTALWREAEASILQHRKYEAAVMKTAPRV